MNNSKFYVKRILNNIVYNFESLHKNICRKSFLLKLTDENFLNN